MNNKAFDPKNDVIYIDGKAFHYQGPPKNGTNNTNQPEEEIYVHEHTYIDTKDPTYKQALAAYSQMAASNNQVDQLDINSFKNQIPTVKQINSKEMYQQSIPNFGFQTNVLQNLAAYSKAYSNQNLVHQQLYQNLLKNQNQQNLKYQSINTNNQFVPNNVVPDDQASHENVYYSNSTEDEENVSYDLNSKEVSLLRGQYHSNVNQPEDQNTEYTHYQHQHNHHNNGYQNPKNALVKTEYNTNQEHNHQHPNNHHYQNQNALVKTDYYTNQEHNHQRLNNHNHHHNHHNHNQNALVKNDYHTNQEQNHQHQQQNNQKKCNHHHNHHHHHHQNHNHSNQHRCPHHNNHNQQIVKENYYPKNTPVYAPISKQPPTQTGITKSIVRSQSIEGSYPKKAPPKQKKIVFEIDPYDFYYRKYFQHCYGRGGGYRSLRCPRYFYY